jgi:hypothetical protein
MQNNQPLHSSNITFIPGEQSFADKILHRLKANDVELITFAIIASEADYRQLSSYHEQKSYADYLKCNREACTQLSIRRAPFIVKELRAAPYLAWLKAHKLKSSNQSSRQLYASFAPMVGSPELLAALGLSSSAALDAYYPDERCFPPRPSLNLMKRVERATTKTGLVERIYDPMGLIAIALALGQCVPEESVGAAFWVLARRIATGLPRTSVAGAERHAEELAKIWLTPACPRN